MKRANAGSDGAAMGINRVISTLPKRLSPVPL